MAWIEGVGDADMRDKWQIKPQFRGERAGVKQVMQLYDQAVPFIRDQKDVGVVIECVFVKNRTAQDKGEFR